MNQNRPNPGANGVRVAAALASVAMARLPVKTPRPTGFGRKPRGA